MHHKKKKITFLSVLLILTTTATIVLAVLFARKSSSTTDTNANLALEIQKNISDTMKSVMDESANPCEDFYQFSCGGWLSSHTLSPSKTTDYLVTTAIEDSNNDILKQIIDSPLQWPMISQFYQECLDNKTHTLPIDQNNKFNALRVLIDTMTLDSTSLAIVISNLHLASVPVFFSFGSAADLLDPTLSIGQLGQGGISLPDPSLYLNDTAGLLPLYYNHAKKMFSFYGMSDQQASQAAKDMIDIETALATISWTAAQLRDINATYNRIDFTNDSNSGLNQLVPIINWSIYLGQVTYGAGSSSTITDYRSINVQVPPFFQSLNTIITNQGLDKIKNYLYFSLIHYNADSLNDAINQEDFNFFQTIINGVSEMEPRWKRCLTNVDAQLGQILGRYYVDKAFDSESKSLAVTMMNYVLASMKEKLSTITWMDENTRSNATLKLSLFQEQIGYPNNWETYAGLSLNYNYYFEDNYLINQWKLQQQAKMIDGKLDRNNLPWGMTTPTVNAYYDPSSNQIVIPAGILQGYYFNRLYHPAINFGGTGATQGHEMTHGFDDQGSQFNGIGKWTSWWSPQTYKNWNNRTKCLSDFYSQYNVIDGMHINGTLTNGENIADCGGIKQSFHAYHNFMKDGKANIPGIDLNANYFSHYNNDQLFFISYAQGWCVEYQPEYLKNMLLTNPHSPGKYRVNGPLSQFDQFAKTFNCPAGSTMNPNKRCDVW